MKWHDHPMAWKQFATIFGLSGKASEIVPKLQQLLLSRKGNNGIAFLNTAAQLGSELLWTQHDRPYYDLYPAVAEAFTKVDLEKLQCKDVKLPISQLLIRLPVGNEIKGPTVGEIRTILVTETLMREMETGIDEIGWLIAIQDRSVKVDNLPYHIVTLRLKPETLIAIQVERAKQNRFSNQNFDEQTITDAIKIIVTLCLLKNNPDLIEPLPLEADRAKWEATHDPKLIQKAAGRGKRGWAIGRHIEIAPGFRRPHFAIRWCGPGGVDPQLKPIKGCLVRRQKITEVPTDWLGPELESVLP